MSLPTYPLLATKQLEQEGGKQETLRLGREAPSSYSLPPVLSTYCKGQMLEESSLVLQSSY